jgi:hypothetical protein
VSSLATISRLAGETVLALAPFLFVLGLQPFAYGIWFQAEPITVGLLALGAAAFVCLLALDLTGHPVWGHPVWAVFRQPVLLCLLLLVAWSAVVSPLQALPARSWFGAPETGEGIFAFLALLSLTALSLILWPYRSARRVMIAAAVTSAAVIGVLNAPLPLGPGWRPQLLGAYGGTVGPAVVMIVLGGYRRPGWQPALLALLAGLPPVLFSQSKIALLLDCVVAPLAYWLLLCARRHWRPARQRRVLPFAPLLAVAVLVSAVAVAMALPPINVYAFMPQHLADTILHFASAGATGSDLFYSVHSRGLLALAGFAAHPRAWLWGFGWGSYADLLYRHTFIEGVKGFQDGVWAPNWEGVGAGAFHVHSDPLEAVFSAGLVAGILYLLMLCAIVRRSRRAMLPIAAVGWTIITGLLAGWYPSLLVYPFLAMAIAACCAPRFPPRQTPPSRAGRWTGRGQRAACLAGAGLLLWGAQATASDALAGGRLLAELNRQVAASLPEYLPIRDDHDRGDVHLWWAALNYVFFLDNQLAQGRKPTAAEAAWYAHLLDEVDDRTTQGLASIRLAALTVAMRNDLAANHGDTALAWLRARELPNWSTWVVRLIRLAPDRTDVAVPDLAWLASQRQFAELRALCGQIFQIHPGDRVCLWYSGIAMLSDPATEEAGYADLRRALALGVGDVAPVTPAARQVVESHVPPAPR